MKLALVFGYRTLRFAAVLGLISLALMVWGVIDPQPISLVIAMSVGQALGTGAFVLYGLVVLTDLRRRRVLASKESMPPSES
jgi:hypothetical protein